MVTGHLARFFMRKPSPPSCALFANSRLYASKNPDYKATVADINCFITDHECLPVYLSHLSTQYTIFQRTNGITAPTWRTNKNGRDRSATPILTFIVTEFG
jgi:hypothetical protein